MTDKDLVAALISRHQMTNEQRLEAAEKHPATLISEIEGVGCPRCSSETLKRVRVARFDSPYAGRVYCTSCEYRDSVMSFLGKSMFPVQPLPQGAAPIYSKDSSEDP